MSEYRVEIVTGHKKVYYIEAEDTKKQKNWLLLVSLSLMKKSSCVSKLIVRYGSIR